MTNLGGHCVETLLEAFAAADDETPTLFIAYTIKGFGLPLAGHKDNHSGMMNPAQIAGLRATLGIAEGAEWEPYGGLGDNAAAALKAFVGRSAFAARPGEHVRGTGAGAGAAASARGRRAIDAIRLRPHPDGPGGRGQSAGRPHRHDRARRDPDDQSRRLRQPARAVSGAAS